MIAHADKPALRATAALLNALLTHYLVVMPRPMASRLGVQLRGVTRAEGAAPATGSMALHRAEQEELLERTFQAL